METPKPTTRLPEKPPAIRIPESPLIEEAPLNKTLDIKNPILANLFHYGMIGIILTIVFIFGGLYLGLRFLGSQGVSFGGAILAGILGGGFCVFALINWISSKDFHDKDRGGF